jgi:hypothetical protein
MAAMSQSDDGGETFKITAWGITQLGRRLAVVTNPQDADATTDNADMATFYCDFVKYTGAVRAGKGANGGLYFTEQRDFEVRAGNVSDDSVFPALTYASGNLTWTFTVGGIGDEPAHWLVEKSADGFGWATAQVLALGVRTANIAGSGTQYWRVRRSDDGVTGLVEREDAKVLVGRVFLAQPGRPTKNAALDLHIVGRNHAASLARGPTGRFANDRS